MRVPGSKTKNLKRELDTKMFELAEKNCHLCYSFSFETLQKQWFNSNCQLEAGKP